MKTFVDWYCKHSWMDQEHCGDAWDACAAEFRAESKKMLEILENHYVDYPYNIELALEKLKDLIKE